MAIPRLTPDGSRRPVRKVPAPGALPDWAPPGQAGNGRLAAGAETEQHAQAPEGRSMNKIGWMLPSKPNARDYPTNDTMGKQAAVQPPTSRKAVNPSLLAALSQAVKKAAPAKPAKPSTKGPANYTG